MGSEKEWMVILQCPCSPEQDVIITKRRMKNALVGSCSLCSRPLVILWNGQLFLVGEIFIEDAK